MEVVVPERTGPGGRDPCCGEIIPPGPNKNSKQFSALET